MPRSFQTTTFRCGNSEAVRLPRGYGFGPGCPVRLSKKGDVVVIERVEPKRALSPAFLAATADPPKGDELPAGPPVDLPEMEPGFAPWLKK